MPGATDSATARPAAARRATTIGRSRPLEQRLLGGVELDQLARGLDARRHQRERLVLAVLSRAKRRHRRLVVGAAAEVVAADPLDGDDPPREELAGRGRDGVAAGSPARPRPPLASTSRARGPQSGQAFGWAWKRRSAGSSYSARQRSHISNAAIVVSGRS